ncbi:MAG: cytochrome c-type biogenesis CcmF C-terminal domain-containing protein, partial [Alphaproteobacteria bacterium]
YYELGWGGFWFWDPVENASFMPWLAGTALLHSAIVTEKRDALKSWTVLLAIITFSLSLLGTFVVRSGVLTSVHAFASDPERGLYILAFLIIVIGGSLTLYAVRAPRLKAGGLFAPISREGSLVLNNLLLSTACATVLLGTMYPLILDALGGGRVSVGGPYFNATFGPLMVPLLLVTAVGPLMPWKRADLAGVLGRLKLAFAAAAAVALGSWALASGLSPWPVLGLGLAAWLFTGTLVELGERLKLFRVPASASWKRARHMPRSAWGMSIAHSGLAIAVAGIVVAQAWRAESIVLMRPGDTVEVAGYGITFDGVREIAGPNYAAERGAFTVTRGGREVVRLFPEKRMYPVQQMPTTEAAIYTTWLADLYVVIGDADGAGGWSTRIYHNPLVPWMWIGALVMVLGGGVSLSDRRLRVGAPARRRRAAAGASPQTA